MTKSIEHVTEVQFPAPSGIKINMMPFVIGDPLSIPQEYGEYLPLIDACKVGRDQVGKVGYLTITETVVAQGKSQRRPGIHTDKHSTSGWGGGGWGGRARSEGIYMASTVDSSCRAWDMHIEAPGPMGDCEHLREELEQVAPIYMRGNSLYWMTDGCPHESLPLESKTFRQYFRFVTSKVDLWYAAHSTVNRLGVVPACRVLEGSKYA